MSSADWIALVPSVLVGMGVIFQAGRLTGAVKELGRRVERIERHIWP
jgi:hypothetical protein